MSDSASGFSDRFDQVINDSDGHAQTYFGRDVLRGLVDGIRQERERRFAAKGGERWWGTAVIGCAMWLNDPELVAELARCESSCIIVTKQADPLEHHRYDGLRPLLGEHVGGLSQRNFPELDELAPAVGGQPVVVGPHGPRLDAHVEAIRELGFRKEGNKLVPIVHAKIALIGAMRWTDEHPSGYLVDQNYFVPHRLWVGSANFTSASRNSLEMGTWITDPTMLAGARQFLLKLVAASEPIGKGAAVMSPELVPVNYDNAAILEAFQSWREPDEGDDDWE